MILTVGIIGLLVLLIVVIAVSYYMNKEGFDTMSGTAPQVPRTPLSRNMPPAVPAVPAMPQALPSLPAMPQAMPSLPSMPQALPSLPSDRAVGAPYDTHASPIPGGMTPQRNDIASQVSISHTGYDAMALQQKSDLLKDIQKLFRNELIAARSTDASMKDTSSCNHTESHSTSQGQEYIPKNKDGCQSAQYIKKDGIPCWGCSLDY